MMLSINITISMDEIKTGLVGFTKCIILSKASMFSNNGTVYEMQDTHSKAFGNSGASNFSSQL